MKEDDMTLTLNDILDASRPEENLSDEFPGNDEMITLNSSLEVMAHGNWIPAEKQLWRSWTGRRRIWGIEYHGPIYVLGTTKDDKPFDGARDCPCHICQHHTHSIYKPN